MPPPLILLTGFGPFEDVAHNPSGAVARALGGSGLLQPPGAIVGVELPVTFRGSARALDRALADLVPARPDALLCTGVHPGPGFRLERRARGVLSSDRPDGEGLTGDSVAAELGGPEDLCTDLDLAALARALRGGGAARVRLSEDAGGYVCERIYRHALLRGRELDIPALFLHVPPLGEVPLEDQLPVVAALVEALRAGLP